MSTTTESPQKWEIIWGVLFILLGGIWLLNNFRILEIDDFWSHWPLIFVVVGAVKFVLASDNRQRGKAFWWIFIGTWLYISIQHLFGLGFGDSWPILIIAWGISILWNAFLARKPKEAQQ